jgi:hypothetical protein
MRRARSFFGEFLVIAAGVLVALAVDQWNEEREDRAREDLYIERLRADLTWDTANFAGFDRGPMAAKTEVLSAFLAEDAVGRLMARPGLVADLNWSSFKALPANRPATFEELQSTGDLSLLRDLELRGALSHYYSGFDHISRILAEPDGDYRERLHAALPGPTMVTWRLDGIEPDSAMLRQGLQRLVGDPGLEGAVNSELTYATGMAFYLREYLSQANRLLDMLNEAR